MLPLTEDIAAEGTTAGASSTARTVEVPVENVRSVEGSGEESMASSAERMAILRMVEQGKISAEDGARLLAALGDAEQSASPPRAKVFDTSRLLQVRVTDLVTNRQKVNVNVPVGLFQLVFQWLPASAKSQFLQVEKAIDAGASGRIVEVVDQDTNVRVEITLV